MTRNRFNRNCLPAITIAALLLAAPMAYQMSLLNFVANQDAL